MDTLTVDKDLKLKKGECDGNVERLAHMQQSVSQSIQSDPLANPQKKNSDRPWAMPITTLDRPLFWNSDGAVSRPNGGLSIKIVGSGCRKGKKAELVTDP